MGKIFKNLVPYWKSVIIIFLLLVVQAFCDLSLPQYTSDIIDTGIQNQGVEHVVPEAVTAEEFETAQLFMSAEECADWKESYKKDGNIYRLNTADKEELEELDEEFTMPLIFNSQMSAVSEKAFKEQVAAQTGTDPSVLEGMTIEEIGQQTGVELHSFTREEEDADGNKQEVTCVDMRPIFQSMVKGGVMKQEDLVESRDQMGEKFETMGDSLIHSMGVAYAVQCMKDAGLNMDHIQTSYLWREGGKMAALALLMAVAAVLIGLFASRVGAGIGRSLREQIYTTVIHFSNTEINRFSTASLITRSTNDIQQIQMVTTMMLRMVLYAPILGIGGIFRVVQTGAGMGWIIVLAIILILGLVLVLMALAMPKFKLMQKLVDGVNLVSREILTGLSVIRAFGREKKEEERFDEANTRLMKTQLFTNRTMTFMMPGMMMIMYGISVLIVWVSANKIDDGTLQVGAMTAFITYTMQIVMSFLMLTMMSIMLPRAGVAAERIDEVIRTESSIQDAPDAEEVKEHNGVIRFEHVSFRYPEAKEDVLEDIDFTAEPGKTTAIIGSTGCGKSTLVNLIPRLYDVTGGKITLDDKDIRKIHMKDLRNEIGLVPQKGVLFSGTIASNLRFGNPNASDAEIEEAAEIAQAMEFIDGKHERFESSIAQGGSNVSGGQKQRLSIARAIAKNPKVFIFDDSFSALDLKTDAALRKALNEKVKGRTVLIVAQRISTILHADQILVLDEGRIVGKGTHEELLADCEVYRQIARSQMSQDELGLHREEVQANV